MNDRAATPPVTDDHLVWDVVWGLYGYPAALITHKLGIFVLIGESPRSLAEVCAAKALPRRSAQALLSASAALGFLTLADGRFTLTPAARDYLLPDSPHYFGHYWDIHIKNDWVMSLSSLEEAVVSGLPQPVPEEIYGFYGHNDETEDFTLAMRGMGASAYSWPALLDFSTYRHMLDVGGGSGTHSIGVLNRYGHMRATVFDLPEVCRSAEVFVKDRGFADRVTTYPGDMFVDRYPRADVHLYSSIFVDWPTEYCARLVAKSFEALPANGRIVVHQPLYDNDKTGPFQTAAHAMEMVAWTKGEPLSAAEFEDMFSAAGFTDFAAHRLPGYTSIATAVKP